MITAYRGSRWWLQACYASIGLIILLAGGCALLESPTAETHQAGADFDAPGAPLDLKCEYQKDPLGLDIRQPRLSWLVNDNRRSAMQAGYQVVVSEEDPTMNSPALVVWDTGMVDSDQSVHVPYEGEALKSSTRYFWRVRTWDDSGHVSPWSPIASWEMGLLNEADWKAKWIIGQRPEGQSIDPEWGDWIWDPNSTGNEQSAFMRRTFDIPEIEKVVSAHVYITVDDRFSLYVNGQPVGQRAGWNIVSSFTLDSFLQSGNNVLAVKGTNHMGNCGMTLAMNIKLADGSYIKIQSDKKWKTSKEASDGWTSVHFDDSHWNEPVITGEYGDAPWNELKIPTRPRQALAMRKEFELDQRIARARAYACGLGIYEMRINGQKVGEDIFTPGWTHYYKRLQYQTYDVTNLIKPGSNAVGVTLGNGWWSGGLGWKSSAQYSDGDLRMKMQIVVEYADGRKNIITTDPSWKSHTSPITRNTYYHGETYDARLAMPGWDKPDFDDKKWLPCRLLEDTPDVMLVAQRGPTIQVTAERTPVHISQPQSGYYIADFGQNAAGRVRIMIRDTEPGMRVRLRFGEVLDPNGMLYRENYRSAEATDYYICKGAKQEIWEPIFTYRGFRYCEITGLSTPPKNSDVVMRVLHSATPEAGRFECSHWLINRILSNVEWGLRSNLHSVPTDCPQRDERLGWMGDAQTFAHTSCFLRDMARFYEKWMFDVTDSQSPEGAVTDVSPAKVVHGAAKPGWGDAVVVIPYTVYRFYGDTRIIEENYDAMAGWVNYMFKNSKDMLYETPGYGDWVAVEKSPTEWIGSAYFYYSTKLLSEMAYVIGKKADGHKYEAMAEMIAKRFNEKHFNEDSSNYLTGTQTCNILPLFFGITQEDDEQMVLQNIVKDIRNRDYHLSTGFLGTTYLMPLLASMGEQETAYQLATQTTYPSWGHMILHGATTIWELWDSNMQGPNMNSRNHFAFGVVARWFYEDVAGIKLSPDVAAFKRFLIQPRPVGTITWAAADYPSVYGLISSAWQLSDAGMILMITVPANTEAIVHVPTLDSDSPDVYEGLKRCTKFVDDGKPRIKRAQGISFVDLTEDAAVFEVGAGTYHFTLHR